MHAFLKKKISPITGKNWRLYFYNIYISFFKRKHIGYHAMVKSENANVTSVVNVIPSDNGISVVFNPNPR